MFTFNSKKAQITLFVILGLVAMLTVGIGIYYISLQEIDSIPEDRVLLQTYDSSISGIVSEVEYCSNSLALQALETIGLQAGYLDESQFRYGYDILSMNNAVEIFQGSNQIVPYWYYYTGNPDCTRCEFRFNMPALEGTNSIQEKVETYIENNMVSCVNNFDNHKNIFDIEYEEINATVDFNDEDTTVFLTWPLTITSLESQDVINAETFFVELDLKFKDIYNAASDLLYELVMGEQMLEDFMINVLDYVSLGGEIPPSIIDSRISLTPSFDYWLREETEEILKMHFSDNINYLQIENSYEYNEPLTGDLTLDNIYSRFVYALPTTDYLQNLRVRFNYFQNWPIHLQVNPSGGEIIFPERKSIPMLFININEVLYDFDYNIQMPVLITLEDESALGGEGYTLRFSTQGNVFSGRPLESDLNEVPEGDLAISFSDLDQASIPINITTRNGADNSPVELEVEYQCINDAYFVGKTLKQDGVAKLETSVPPCIDGVFKVLNQSYMADPHIVTINEDFNEQVDILVYEKKNMTFNLRKKVLDKYSFEEDQVPTTNWTLTDQFISNEVDEQVLLMLTSVDSSGQPTGIFNIFTLNSSTGFSGNLELAPGTYEYLVVNMLNMGDNYSRPHFNTSHETFTVGSSGFLGFGGDEETVHINSTQINDSMLVGYASFSENSDYLQITAEDIQNNDHVDLYYAGYRLSDLVYTRELQVLSDVTQASIEKREMLLPEFS